MCPAIGCKIVGEVRDVLEEESQVLMFHKDLVGVSAGADYVVGCRFISRCAFLAAAEIIVGH